MQSLTKLDALISEAETGSLLSSVTSCVLAQVGATTRAPHSEAAPAASAAASDPEMDKRMALVTSVGEECVTEPELRNLLQKKPNFILYDGFEPSGRMHIAQGVFKAMNVNKCTQAGGTFIFWVADWFALMNDKMGGDLERIKTVGQYLIQVWTAAGMDMTRVKFLWSSEEITKNARSYWTQMMDIARRFTIARIKKCCQIMGRLEDTLTAAQILYPIMQCTDIFFLKADICQLGVDQRKVNMLAREYCDYAGIKLKPIILSHHMLYGLCQGQMKMSKSNKESAIFMEDAAEDVERKIQNAYCPRTEEKEQQERREEESMHLTEDKLKNPCLDYVEHIIFCLPGTTFTAGGTTFSDFVSVRDAFLSERLSESDLKAGLVTAVNKLLEPVRTHFQEDAEARRILELITGWMQEPKSTTHSGLRRLVAFGSQTQPRCVVFAPLASAKPTLGAALDTLRCLAAAPVGSSPVLWLNDWSAFCLNCLSGGKTREDDLKAIAAANRLFVAALEAIAPGLMGGVQVVVQSEAVLGNSSDYWISVINAGRAFPLSAIRAVDEANENACQVISSLMHVADVLATSAPTAADPPTCISATSSQVALHELAFSYFLRPEVKDAGLSPPQLVQVPTISLRLKAGTDAEFDPDAELLLFDGQPDVQRKMKKAFCEPGNVDNCPPLTIAEAAVLPFSMDKNLIIKRKEQDGGDLVFSDPVEMRAKFQSGELHPGDLKPATRDAVDALLQRVRTKVQSQPELGAADKEVQKVVKRSAKGGKK